jgi:hypothetical protein
LCLNDQPVSPFSLPIIYQENIEPPTYPTSQTASLFSMRHGLNPGAWVKIAACMERCALHPRSTDTKYRTYLLQPQCMSPTFCKQHLRRRCRDTCSVDRNQLMLPGRSLHPRNVRSRYGPLCTKVLFNNKGIRLPPHPNSNIPHSNLPRTLRSFPHGHSFHRQTRPTFCIRTPANPHPPLIIPTIRPLHSIVIPPSHQLLP